MNWDEQTIKTYDKSATALAEYFQGIGSRTNDINRGLELANASETARVVEIGCGDGRDASEIIKRCGWYEGFDPSKGLLDIAKSNLTQASFVLADALTYNYPENLDVVYAFASLLHINKDDLTKVFKIVVTSLRPGGIFYISLKERDEYTAEVKKDNYGERMFYFYNPDLIGQIARDLFTTVYVDHQKIGQTRWFTIALKRVNT